MARRVPQLRLTRDLFMFGLGSVAFTFELVSGGDRPNILYGSMALMGVAAYLRAIAASDKEVE